MFWICQCQFKPFVLACAHFLPTGNSTTINVTYWLLISLIRVYIRPWLVMHPVILVLFLRHLYTVLHNDCTNVYWTVAIHTNGQKCFQTLSFSTLSTEAFICFCFIILAMFSWAYQPLSFYWIYLFILSIKFIFLFLYVIA